MALWDEELVVAVAEEEAADTRKAVIETETKTENRLLRRLKSRHKSSGGPLKMF